MDATTFEKKLANRHLASTLRLVNQMITKYCVCQLVIFPHDYVLVQLQKLQKVTIISSALFLQIYTLLTFSEIPFILQLYKGRALGQVFNFRSGCMHTMHLRSGVAIQPNLELKTWPKQLLGSLHLVIALPDGAKC